jgi:hypothetical protein
MYALETDAVAGFRGPAAGSGRVVLLLAMEGPTVATGPTFPTARTFGPDGRLHVSNKDSTSHRGLYCVSCLVA